MLSGNGMKKKIVSFLDGNYMRLGGKVVRVRCRLSTLTAHGIHLCMTAFNVQSLPSISSMGLYGKFSHETENYMCISGNLISSTDWLHVKAYPIQCDQNALLGGLLARTLTSERNETMRGKRERELKS